jgi:hypothetical protein
MNLRRSTDHKLRLLPDHMLSSSLVWLLWLPSFSFLYQGIFYMHFVSVVINPQFSFSFSSCCHFYVWILSFFQVTDMLSELKSL